MNRFLTAIATLCLATTLGATEKSDSAEKPNLDYIPYGNLQNLSKEQIEDASKLGQDLARQMLNVYQNNVTPERTRMAEQVKRRVDDIADASIADERDKILKFLGIDNASTTALYYFVTWEMPLEMLRSYAVEAMWSGGTLVFKGVPPDKKLGDFILKELRLLVYGKGASANISIDPRLYDAYKVKVAPTIVLTNVRGNFSCQGTIKTEFMVGTQKVSYNSCPPIDESQYSKMAGAVTTQYALQTFLDDGRKEAKPFLDAMAKGLREGQVAQREQIAFTGEWDDVLSPAAKLQQEQEREAAKRATEMLIPKQ